MRFLKWLKRPRATPFHKNGGREAKEAAIELKSAAAAKAIKQMDITRLERRAV